MTQEQVPDSTRQACGVLQALAGNHSASISILAPLVDAGTPLPEAGTQTFVWQTLARAYLQRGEPDSAEQLLRGLERGFVDREKRGQLHLRNERADYAMNALLLGDPARAQAALHDPRRAAVQALP